MKRLIFAILMIIAAAGAANAQCAGSVIAGCPTAVNPQPTDVIPLWQYGLTPNMRKLPISVLLSGGSQPVIATGTNTPRTLSNRFADVVNVRDWACSSGVSCLVGTGGDDIAAIQAAVNQAAASGAQEVFFPQPPSGAYNICAASIELPGQTVSLRLQGATVGGTTIRILPSCASPPQQVIHQPRTTSQTDTTRITLSHLTVDAYCKAAYDLYAEFAVGLNSDHVAYRNAATGGANIRIGSGGFEYDIGATNTAENVNDTGHTCYNTKSDLPLYNLWTSGTDSSFSGLIAVNAQTANFFQDSGGNNRYIGSHAYNYLNFPTAGVDFRSNYGFYIEGSAFVMGSYSEDSTVAGFYIANAAGVSYTNVVGNKCDYTGNPSNSVFCVELATGLTYTNVVDTNAWQIKFIGHPENIVHQDGTADATTMVRDNGPATYNSPWNFISPGANAQETWVTLSNPNTTSFALTGMLWNAHNSTGELAYQDAGTGTGGYFIFQPESSTGTAPTLHVVDGADGYDVMGGNIGSEALRAILSASAVNRIDVTGGTTGNGPQIRSNGSDTNVPMIVSTKGTGQIFLEPNGSLVTQVDTAGLHMNALPVFPAATTVASLPTCNSGLTNAIMVVSDASSPTYNGSLTGGSTTRVLAFCNGSAWTAH